MAVNILIADDHDIIREGIKSVLSGHPEYRICAEAGDGEEAIELAEKFKPDVLLMDVSMPKLSGLDALPRIKKVSPDTKVIMITVHKMGGLCLKGHQKRGGRIYQQGECGRGADYGLEPGRARTDLSGGIHLGLYRRCGGQFF